MPGRSAGYSGTPLVRKLGLREGQRTAFVGAPTTFHDLLGPLPGGIVLLSRPGRDMDLIVLFARSRAQLQRRLGGLAERLAPKGMLWVAWPKRSSGVASDLSFDAVQTAALSASLVDVKICAVDETWSALKLVIPVARRGPRP